MSVSLLEVIQHSGYDINKEEDARWFLSKVNEFEQLVIKCEDMIEEIENEQNE